MSRKPFSNAVGPSSYNKEYSVASAEIEADFVTQITPKQTLF